LPAITRKTRKGFAALALAAAVALPQTGFTQSALTLAEAQRIAVERSRQLAAQDASITAAREMAVAAGQLPDPVLRLGIDNLPVDGADRFSVERDFMTMRRIGVMQEFTRDGKRKLRTARGEREADRAVAEKTVTLTNIQRDTALAWLERFYLERTRAVVAAQAEEARLEIEAAEGAYRAGRGSQADIYTARAARVALEDRLSELDRRIRNARVMLARWVGNAADAPLAGDPAVKTLMFETHTLDQALERHPEIALLGRQVAVAESEVQLARANKRSDWSVELAYQERGPAFSNMISVGISIPLQWDQKNRQDRELGAKLALAERAKALREDILRAHTAEVRTMLNEWENGHERLARYERELIPLAKDRTQAALAAYRGGKADLNAVLAARRNEIEVRTQTVQLEMETARLWAQLNFLVPDGAHESHSGAAAAAREEK
jgi:outer membrane protein TolC